MTTEPSTPEMDPHIAALHRAMPFIRLVDCGMNPADARRLLDRSAAGEGWIDTAVELSETRAAGADAAEDAGHVQTAAQSTRWAAAAALFAQMAENLDTPVKASLYARYTELTRRFAELRDPALERVEVPFRNGHLVGWLSVPDGGRTQATVVVWGGLSGWGAAYLSLAEALADRGLACLLVEGPGQGEPRLNDKIYVDAGVADGFAKFLDFVESRADLGAQIGVCGNSFGGLFAAHLAAQDPRVNACVINGAPPVPELPPFRTAREQFAAALGTDDEAELRRTLGLLRFDPEQQPIRCPVLVLQGGHDTLLPDEDAQVPFVWAAGDRGELRVWPDGEHTLYNHSLERDAYLADWFTDQLCGP